MRKFNPDSQFKLKYSDIGNVLVNQSLDLCMLNIESDDCQPVELADEIPENASWQLRGRPVRVRSMTATEVTLEWEPWLLQGMSGSGIYVDGKLLAVLSRVKPGEYAVGVRVQKTPE